MSKFIVKWSDNEESNQVAEFASLEDAKKWIRNQTVQDRYSPSGFDCESPEEVNEDKLMPTSEKTVRGFALATDVNGKRQFLNFSPSLPFLTDFPYSVNDVPFGQRELDVLSKPPFGNLKRVECIEVEYLEKDAERFFKQGGIPSYKVIESSSETEVTEDESNEVPLLRSACAAVADSSKEFAAKSFGAMSDWAEMPASDAVAGAYEQFAAPVTPGRNIDFLDACIKRLQQIQNARDTKMHDHEECSVWLEYLSVLKRAIANKSEAMKRKWLKTCVDDIYDVQDKYYAMLTY